MDWRPPPTKSATLEQCDNKNDEKKATTDWRPPPSRTSTAAVKSLLEWKPAPGWKPRLTSDEDLRNPAAEFQQAPIVPPNAGQPILPPGVVSGPVSGGQPVMMPIQVNSGQPPPHVGVGPPPAVHPPPPVQPTMVPPPTLNCQVPPLMGVTVASQSGEPSIPGVVLPPMSSAQICTPPRDNHQRPPASFTQTPPPVLPVPPPNVSLQAQHGPSPGQTVPPGIVPDNHQCPPASFTQTPPPLLPVPPPNVPPQNQCGPSPDQTVPPGVVRPPMSGAHPHPQVVQGGAPLLPMPVQGPPPPAFSPNHLPPPGMGPHHPPDPGVGPVSYTHLTLPTKRIV